MTTRQAVAQQPTASISAIFVLTIESQNTSFSCQQKSRYIQDCRIFKQEIKVASLPSGHIPHARTPNAKDDQGKHACIKIQNKLLKAQENSSKNPAQILPDW